MQPEFFPEVRERIQEDDYLSSKSIFSQVKLSDSEECQIEKLLVDNYSTDTGGEKKVAEDIEEMKKITMEIKTIGKQSILLQGERIHKARSILKNYKRSQSTFTQWLEKTFKNRRTAYNILSYYELYCSLPNESLRVSMKKIPLQAAYTLASREGNMEVKEEDVPNLVEI